MAYLNLKAEMARYNITIDSIAKLISVHRNSVANKIKGKGSFSIEQASKIQNTYFPNLDLIVLFKKE